MYCTRVLYVTPTACENKIHVRVSRTAHTAQSKGFVDDVHVGGQNTTPNSHPPPWGVATRHPHTAAMIRTTTATTTDANAAACRGCCVALNARMSPRARSNTCVKITVTVDTRTKGGFVCVVVVVVMCCSSRDGDGVFFDFLLPVVDTASTSRAASSPDGADDKEDEDEDEDARSDSSDASRSSIAVAAVSSARSVPMALRCRALTNINATQKNYKKRNAPRSFRRRAVGPFFFRRDPSRFFVFDLCRHRG